MAAFLLAGCYVPRIHKTDEFNTESGVHTLAIDAKQRVVLVAKIPNSNPQTGFPGTTTTTTTTKSDDGKSQTEVKTVKGGLVPITCAEPSPDAMSALSTSIGTGFSDPKVAANFALAQAESAASIGLRTQSIQLLRDGMYRLCEGYAGGAIDSDEFNRQQRRYQNLMLSLLAIEQLTGAVVPRQVGLGQGASSASVGQKADEAAGNLAKTNSDLTAAQAALKKAQDAQTKDEQDCKDDPKSAACGKAADDKTAVDNAQTALNKATEAQKTAQTAMLAARTAVTADATGARVEFSDAPKTNQITDGTARYIAEATRTIVSTTLLASFAQEECTNVWTYFKSLTPEQQLQLATLDEATAKADAESLITAETAGANLTNAPATKPKESREAVTRESEFVHLAKNCQHNQDLLFQQAALFTPQYGATPAGPLQVLGGQGGITMAPTDGPLHFFIVGGVTPYHVSNLPPSLKGELQVSIPTAPSNGNYELVIERPKGATKEDKAIIFVVDSNNAYVQIPVSLTKTGTPPKQPPPPKKPATPKAPDPPKITDAKAAAGGKITVTFTAPESDGGSPITEYTATAVDSKGGLKPVERSTPDEKVAPITLSGCTAGDSYIVTLMAKNKVGSGQPAKAPKPVTCLK